MSFVCVDNRREGVKLSRPLDFRQRFIWLVCKKKMEREPMVSRGKIRIQLECAPEFSSRLHEIRRSVTDSNKSQSCVRLGQTIIQLQGAMRRCSGFSEALLHPNTVVERQ